MRNGWNRDIATVKKTGTIKAVAAIPNIQISLTEQMITTTDIQKSIPAEKFAELFGIQDKNALLREASFAVQLIAANPKLQECSQKSTIKAIWNAAACGLTLNPLEKLAYLTPRWNSKANANECLFMPSYIGLSKLAQEGGIVKKIESRIVYANDVFSVEYEPKTQIIHQPKFGKDKGDMIAVYAIATLPNGLKQFEVMGADEIFEIRAMSDSWKAFEDKKAKSSIWKDHEGEMCRKTVIRRLTKHLPKGEAQRFNEAVKLDTVDYMATSSQLNHIEALIRTSTFDENKRTQIEYLLGAGELTREQAESVITDLENNQQNAITQRGHVSPKAIQLELDSKDGK